jgi:protocatechuate 3,4-dioxygenase beta subunit
MVSSKRRNLFRYLFSGFSLLAGWLLASCSAAATSPADAPSPAPTQPAAVAQPATQAPQATSQPPELASTDSAPSPMPLALSGTYVPTPDCSTPAALTPSMTEGPYYKTGSPERASLIEPGMPGTSLWLSGYVLTVDCQPVTHAWLDFWQANAQGQYDNNGYTLRGHEFTDANGYYSLETILPGLYPGRTEHIHVKVQAQGGPVLTTQLFFPGVAQNQKDSIYSDQLLLAMQETPDGYLAVFNFVVQVQQ